MTREEAILYGKERVEIFGGENREFIEIAIKSLDQESKIEKEIRKEINNLSTYRFNNSDTDLVSLNAVERVLNLVFRGCRDKESNNEKEVLK